MKNTCLLLLKDLKKYILIWGLFFITFFSLSFFFKKSLYEFITLPVKQLNIVNINFIYTSIFESFNTDISLCLYSSFIICFPILLFCIYKFVSPSLYRNEKRVFIKLISFCLILCLLATFFMYKIIFPRALHFFLKNNSTFIEPMLKISEYVYIFFHLIILICIIFQLPIIFYCLVKFNIVNKNFLSKNRRISIVLIFIISAIITPPDVVSQVICAFFLIIIYELTNIVIKFVDNKKTKKKYFYKNHNKKFNLKQNRNFKYKKFYKYKKY